MRITKVLSLPGAGEMSSRWRLSGRGLLLAVSLACWGALGTGAIAQVEQPAINFVSGELVSPSDFYASGLFDVSDQEEAHFPNELIASLAYRLGGEAEDLADYVYSRVETVPAFGVQKGAVGALLNGAGTAFDQAELLHELARTSGLSSRIVYGTVVLDQQQALSHFGTDDATAIQQILANGGVPASVSSGGGSVSSVSMVHAWTEIMVDQSWVTFDTAIKINTLRSREHIDGLRASFGAAGAQVVQTLKSTSTSEITGANITIQRNFANDDTANKLTILAADVYEALSAESYFSLGNKDFLGVRSIKAFSLPEVQGVSYSKQNSWENGIPDDFKVRVVLSSCSVTEYYVDEQYRDQLHVLDPEIVAALGTYEGEDTLSAARREATNGLPVDILSCAVAPPLGSGNYAPSTDLTVMVDHPYPGGGGTYADKTYEIDALHGFSRTWRLPVEPPLIRVDVGESRLQSRQKVESIFPDSSTRWGLTPYGIPDPFADNDQLAPIQSLVAVFAQVDSIRQFVGRVLGFEIHSHHKVVISGPYWRAIDMSHDRWDPPYGDDRYAALSGTRVYSLTSTMSVSHLRADSKSEIQLSEESLAASKTVSSMIVSVESFTGLNYVANISASSMLRDHMYRDSSNGFLRVSSQNISSVLPFLNGRFDDYSKSVLVEMVNDGYVLVIPERKVSHWLFKRFHGTEYHSGRFDGDFSEDWFQPILGFREDGSFTALVAKETHSGLGMTIKGGAGAAADLNFDQLGMNSDVADKLNSGLWSASELVSVDTATGAPTVSLPGFARVGSTKAGGELSVGVTYATHVAGAVQKRSNFPVNFLLEADPLIGFSLTGANSDIHQSVRLGSDLNLSLGKQANRDASQALMATMTLFQIFSSEEGDVEKLVASAVVGDWVLGQWRDGVATVEHGSGGVDQFVKNPEGRYVGNPRSQSKLQRYGKFYFVPHFNKMSQRFLTWKWSDGAGNEKIFDYIENKDLVQSTGGDFSQVSVSGMTETFSADQDRRNYNYDYPDADTLCYVNSATGGVKYDREREFWGTDAQFRIIRAEYADGEKRHYTYKRGPVDRDPEQCYETPPPVLAYSVSDNLGRKLHIPGNDFEFVSDAGDIFSGEPGGRFGGCLKLSDGEPIFRTLRAAFSTSEPCSFEQGEGLTGLAAVTRNSKPILMAQADGCDVLGVYSGAVKSGCTTQKYFLGETFVPFVTMEMDPYSSTVLSARDAAENKTEYFMVEGHRSVVVDPLGGQITVLYDDEGRVFREYDKKGRVREVSYDSLGRKISEFSRWNSDDEGTYQSKRTYAYDLIGNLRSTTTWPKSTSSEEDPQQELAFYEDENFVRNVTKTVDADGYAAVTVYHENGLVKESIGAFKDLTPEISSDDPDCESGATPCVSYEYDNLGRVIETKVKIDVGIWQRTENEFSESIIDHFELRSTTVHPEEAL